MRISPTAPFRVDPLSSERSGLLSPRGESRHRGCKSLSTHHFSTFSLPDLALQQASIGVCQPTRRMARDAKNPFYRALPKQLRDLVASERAASASLARASILQIHFWGRGSTRKAPALQAVKSASSYRGAIPLDSTIRFQVLANRSRCG